MIVTVYSIIANWNASITELVQGIQYNLHTAHDVHQSTWILRHLRLGAGHRRYRA